MTKNTNKLNIFLSGQRLALAFVLATASVSNFNKSLFELESIGRDPYAKHRKWRNRPFQRITRAERKERDQHRKQVSNIKMSRKKW